MELGEKEINEYSLHEDTRLFYPEYKLSRITIEKLVNYRNNLEEGISSITGYLIIRHHRDKVSLTDMAHEIGISQPTMRRLVNKVLQIPIRTDAEGARAKWANPEHARQHKKSLRKMISDRKKDSNYSEQMSQASKKSWEGKKGEEHRKKVRKITTERNESPPGREEPDYDESEEII
ncbi:hypothetical protein COU60_05100 [Candidatus Pacearchaeota archaeon CG10_big_fil_rev_8_21_14_0_10_34_76]|nr:MAG: hypothetical protein COU60_05100 [Candidatus Pacearchaeota archaeon CG10_big_fil_rev_8_21_14_0_10_34_76]